MLYLDYVGNTWCKIFMFPKNVNIVYMFVKGVALLVEVNVDETLLNG